MWRWLVVCDPPVMPRPSANSPNINIKTLLQIRFYFNRYRQVILHKNYTNLFSNLSHMRVLFSWSKVDFCQSKRKINCIYLVENNFEQLHVERQYGKFLYIHGDHWYFLSSESLNCIFISFIHFLNGLLILVFLISSSFYILKDPWFFCNMRCKCFSWSVFYFAYSAFLYIGFFRNFLM